MKKFKITPQFVVTLVGVLLMIGALFLPYMTAVGDMAEYIEKNPDRVEIESLDLTAGDLASIPIVSVSNIITGLYGEDDGVIATIIVSILIGLLALTALFVILQKPIAAIIFDLLTCGGFVFLSILMKEDFIAANKYAWGIGYYSVIVAVIAVFVGAVWLLIMKANSKRETKKAEITNLDK